MRGVLIGNLGVNHGAIECLVLLPVAGVYGRKDCRAVLVGLERGLQVIPANMLRPIVSLSEVGEEGRGAVELLDIEGLLVPLLKVY